MSDAQGAVTERPLAAYAVLLAVHGGVVGGALAVAMRNGKVPSRLGLGDLALGAAATYKLSRLLARSSVTSPLRAPFTGEAELAGPAELVEDVEGDGLQRAVGELLTCPFCLGHWIATAYGLGLAFAPDLTRTMAGMLAVEAGADVLQHLHARFSS